MKTELKEYIVIMLGLLGSFFAPVFGVIVALIFATLIDHIFGIWKSVMLKETISIKKGLAQTALKAFLYLVLMLSCFMIDKAAINDVINAIAGKQEVKYIFTKGVSIVLFAIELYSINRNYKKVKGVGLFFAIMEGIGKAKKQVSKISEIKNGLSIFLLAISLLFSCQSGKKLYERAVKKGVQCDPIKEIHLKTVRDTIVDEKTKTVFISEKVVKVDTIYKDGKVEFPMTKREFKIQKIKEKNQGKTDKIKEKNKGKTDKAKEKNQGKNKFSLVYLFGLVFSAFAGVVLGYILSKFTR